MPQLIIINNIPTPYRNYTFSVLHEELQQRDMTLKVLFMAKTEPYRFWPVNPEEWNFDGRIVPGIKLWMRTTRRLYGFPIYVNPGIWATVIRTTPSWLMLAGSWHMPTPAGLLLLKPLRHKMHVLLWSEANSRSSRYPTDSMVAHLRRIIVKRADGYVIPGELAEKAIIEHWGVTVTGKPFIALPNLIDETKFQKAITARQQCTILRQKYQVPEYNRVLFWGARLDEESKGILNFLNAVKNVLLPSTTILIAGDGPDRERIRAWSQEHPAHDVRLLGHIAEHQMIEFFGLSDVAILPSFHDQSPLIVIEAMWAGLPILTSVNCGNYPETVRPGINGWLVDPENAESLRQAVLDIQDCAPETLLDMGQQSLALARQNFSSRDSIRRFVDDLVAQFPPKV